MSCLHRNYIKKDRQGEQRNEQKMKTLRFIPLPQETLFNCNCVSFIKYNKKKSTTAVCNQHITLNLAEKKTKTDLGKSFAHSFLNLPLHLLVCFVSQKHYGNVLACTLLEGKRRKEYSTKGNQFKRVHCG